MSTAFGTGVTGPDGRSLDQVRLSGVSARGYHGVLPSERQTGQEFRADVVLYLDTRPAAAGDELTRTVSYADVARDVHDILAGEPADLVETVAERIAAAVLTRPQIEAVDVCVHKPHAPIPVPFADVEVAIRRDRTHVPVVAAPATAGAVEPVTPLSAGPAAEALGQAAEPAEAQGYQSFEADPEPQDFEPVARPTADAAEQLSSEPLPAEPYRPEPAEPFRPEAAEPYRPDPVEPVQRAESFEPEPLMERVPGTSSTASPAEAPEPLPVPELIAPEPPQLVPAAWDLPPDAAAQLEQRDGTAAREPAFQPEALRSEPVFEPVQQYEPAQDLDQRQGASSRSETDRSSGFEQQPYDPFPHAPAQPEPQGAFEQPAQPDQPQFDAPQFDQSQFEQRGYEQSPQPDPQQNQYDQLFDQQYDQADLERTRVTGAVPDRAVGQPEQPYAGEQYAAGEYQPERYQNGEQYQAEGQFQNPEQYQAEGQNEPRDRFDELPAGYVEVVIAIGANLGDPQATMRSAVAELDRTPGLQITDVSPLARTAAVGGPEEQPDYLNAVLLARTTLSARGLLHACQEIENVHGRVREERWGARTLDVDLITYGSLTDSADDLEVPHPRAHERAFVLEPWSQIAPDAVLPGLGGGPVAQLAATAPDRTGIRWLALDWLTDPEPEQSGGTTGSNHPAVPDDAGQQAAPEAAPAEMPPALPPSLPPSGRPQASPGGPVVEVPGGGHPQSYTSGPVPGQGGSAPISPQASQAVPATPRGGAGGTNGSAVPPPEEALVPAPAPLAPRAVRDTAHEAPEHEPLPAGAAKPVFAPVNPSRQPSSGYPPAGGVPQDHAAPVFAPVGTPPNGVSGAGQNGQVDAPVSPPVNGQANGHANGHPNGQSNGHPNAYDSDHTVIRVPGFVGEQQQPAPSDGPIDSVPSWAPVRDERGRDA